MLFLFVSSLSILSLFIFYVVHDPPSICVEPPWIDDFADVCLRLHGIRITQMKHFNSSGEVLKVCVDLEARLKKIKVAKLSIGCLTVGGLTVLLDDIKKALQRLEDLAAFSYLVSVASLPSSPLVLIVLCLTGFYTRYLLRWV